MFEENSDFIKIINEYVSSWTKKHIFYTEQIEDTDEGNKRFMCQFSLPQDHKPIPISIVKVYFFTEKQDNGKYDLKYQFETDELIHDVKRTVRLSMMERWLEKYLEKKNMTRRIFFLATEFESTRIVEERLKGLEKHIPVVEKVKKINSIEKDMLEFDDLMGDWVDPISEQENFKMMRRSVFQIFRSYDRNDLQLISKEEFFDMLKMLGLNLSEEQRKKIYSHYDFSTDGLLKYQHVNEILVEILMGHIFFSAAQRDRVLRAEHHYNMAILILFPSPIYDTINEIVEECHTISEGYHCIKTESFHDVMWHYNTEDKGFIQKKEEEEDDGKPSEFEEIYELIKSKFEKEGEIYYGEEDEQGIYEMLNEIVKFKANKIARGLVDNDRGKFEKFLMEYFETLDKEKTGKISLEVLFKGLQECKKFDLILTQELIISQISPKDENGLFDYKENSFDLACYLHFLAEEKNEDRMRKYVHELIPQNELIGMYDFTYLQEESIRLIEKYDEDEDGMLSQEEFNQIFTDFNHIYFDEGSPLEMFNLIDTKMDGFIDMSEISSKGRYVLNFKIRNDTLNELKTKFVMS